MDYMTDSFGNGNHTGMLAHNMSMRVSDLRKALVMFNWIMLFALAFLVLATSDWSIVSVLPPQQASPPSLRLGPLA